MFELASAAEIEFVLVKQVVPSACTIQTVSSLHVYAN